MEFKNKKLHPSRGSHSAERRAHSDEEFRKQKNSNPLVVRIAQSAERRAKTKHKKSPTPLVVRIAQSAERIAMKNLENKKTPIPS